MSVIKKLQIIKKLSEKSQAELAVLLNTSTQTFNSWINGKSTPRDKAVEKIDSLYIEYVGDLKIGGEVLKTKKVKLTELKKRYSNPFKAIMARRDLYDNFLLETTYHTNSIEGSTFNEPEVKAVLFDDVTIPKKSVVEHQEVKNHQAALGYVMRLIKDKEKVDETVVRQINQIVMNGIIYNAGTYRAHAVRIVGSKTVTVNHVKIPEKIKSFLKLYNQKPKDVIKHIAETHALFEQIHPFSDGNGRTGRLLMLILAFKNDLAPVLIIKEKKMAYYNYLEEAQVNENYVPLTSFIYDALFEGYGLVD